MPSTFGRLAILAFIEGAFFARVSVAQAEPTATVLFVAPPLGEVPDTLRDALSAQFSGGESVLEFEHFTADASTLRRQVQEARKLAASHHAVGVFWLARHWGLARSAAACGALVYSLGGFSLSKLFNDVAPPPATKSEPPFQRLEVKPR